MKARVPVLAVLVIAALSAPAAAGPAPAAVDVQVSPQGALTIEIGGATAAADVTCLLTTVHVNGVDTTELCADITSIHVEGSNNSDDIDVAAVNVFSFAQNPTISVNGRGGDDDIMLGLSKETVSGGPGFDTIELYPLAPDTFTITDAKAIIPGDTTKMSSIEAVEATLPAGSNLFDASAFSGRISVVGGPDHDEIIGGPGDDALLGNGDGDVLRGNGGDDTLIGLAGNDGLLGGPGIDGTTFEPTANLTVTDSTAVSASTGNDVLNSIDIISVDAGAPGLTVNLSGFSGPATWIGTTGNDTVSGSTLQTTFLPGDGDDTMTGNAIGDPLEDGSGDVLFVSAAGASTFGSTGSTTPTGNDSYTGMDALFAFGSSGGDAIDAADFTGSALLLGGDGSDILIGSAFPDILEVGDLDTADGNGGKDTMGNYTYFEAQVLTDDAYTGPSLNAALESVEHAELTAAEDSTIDASDWSGTTRLNGNIGNERLTGGSSRDLLFGEDGNDRLRGLGGNDRLFGSAGNDRINGGANRDTCIGGPGRDRLRACERGSAEPLVAPPLSFADATDLVEEIQRAAGI